MKKLLLCGVWLGLIFAPVHAQNLSATPAFILSSPAFADQGNIPPKFTCDAENINPQLYWQNAPITTESFALIVSDPDASNGTFYHWVLFNIPKEISGIENALAQGTLVGKNSYGSQKYMGPCPPRGEGHKYVFTLYALDTTLVLPAGEEVTSVMNAMQNHIVGEAILRGAYTRASEPRTQ